MENLPPTDDELLAFARGDCSDELFERIAYYLEHVDNCEDRFRRLNARVPQDGLIQKVRQYDRHEIESPSSKSDPSSPNSTVGASPNETIRDVPSPAAAFGDYELIEEIGRGGMGVVWKARQKSLNRTVAIKMILGGQLASMSDVRRFRTEAEAAANLDHPGIVPIFDVGQYDGQPFLSMGIVEGESLANKLRSGPLSPMEAAQLMLPIAEAVHYAHQHGVIHRDLKPDNVLLDREGHPRITDFGLAKQLGSDAGLTQSGQVMGTPSYMPPEQALGKTTEIGPTSDVYALGAILFALTTGRPPVHAVNAAAALRQVIDGSPPRPSSLNKSIDRDLETIVLKCLEKQPTRRYESARYFGEDIARWINREPINARPVTTLERTIRWCQRRPLIASLAIGICLVSLAGIAGIVWQWRHAQTNYVVAQRQRQRAETRLSNARAAIARLLDRAESLKDVPKMEHVRRQLFEDAVELYQEFLASEASAVLVEESARVHRSVADIDRRLDRLVESLGSAQVAVDEFSRLVEQSPDEENYRYQLALSLSSLGESNRQLAKDQDAMEAHQKAYDLLRQLLDDFHDKTEYNRALARQGTLLANMLYQSGSFDSVQQLATEALELQKRVVAHEPDDPAELDRLAYNYRFLGTLASRNEEVDEAVELLTRALDLTDSTVESQPNARDYRRNLAVTQTRLADVLAKKGQVAESIKQYHESIETLRDLAANFPDIKSYRVDLIVLQNNVAYKLRQHGRHVDSEELYREVIRLRREAVAAAVDRVDEQYRRRHLANSYISLGEVHVILGQMDSAEEAYNVAIETFRAIADKLPDVPLFQKDLAWLLATCPVRHLREADEAIAYARSALDHDPTSAGYLKVLGGAMFVAGNHTEASNLLKESLSRSPGSVDALLLLAMAQWRLGEQDAAHHSYESAIKSMGTDNENLRLLRSEVRQIIGVLDHVDPRIDGSP